MLKGNKGEWSEIYTNDEEYFFKLNLQIRFVK